MSKIQFSRALLATLMVLGITANCLAGPYTSGRIIPTDKVSIYSGDTRVGEYTKEAPLPLQSILTCSGDCAVRMRHLYARIRENTTFSIDETSTSRTLFVKDGGLFFALPALEKQLVIVTSAGAITVQEAILQTANQTDNLLNGYVRVTRKRTEVGVINGGALVVSTSNGQSTIQSGNRLVLYAMAQPKSNLSETELQGFTGKGSGAMEEEDDDTVWPAWLALVVGGRLLFKSNPEEAPKDSGASPKVP